MRLFNTILITLFVILSLGGSGCSNNKTKEDDGSTLILTFSSEQNKESLSWILGIETATVSHISTIKDKDLFVYSISFSEELGVFGLGSSASKYPTFETLVSVRIPNTVWKINKYALAGCKALTSVQIPASVTKIELGAFMGCEALASIVLPDSVTEIDNSAFAGCKALERIELPNKITSIKGSTFENCESLTSISIPNSVTSIEDEAFAYCNTLASIEIPDSVTKMHGNPFKGCISLYGFSGKNLSGNGEMLFFRDELISCHPTIKEARIPTGVSKISSKAFDGCDSLFTIDVPSTISEFDYFTFSYCKSVHRFTGDFATADGQMLVFHNELIAIVPGIENAIIPEGVTYISDVFWFNDNIKTIIIPSSVKRIKRYAFRDCPSLSFVYFESPGELEIIEDGTFETCKSLTYISLPSSLKSIGSSAFAFCESLSYIEIPYSVTKIEPFAFKGCKSLRTAVISNPQIEVGMNAFQDCPVETTRRKNAGGDTSSDGSDLSSSSQLNQEYQRLLSRLNSTSDPVERQRIQAQMSIVKSQIETSQRDFINRLTQ